MAVLGSTLLFLALLGFVLATCAEARQALVICPSIVRAVEGLLNNVSIHGSALSFDGAMAIKRGGSAVRRGNYSACDGQSGHFWFKGGDLPSDDWPPLVFNARTMVAMVLAAIGASLSSAGGVGGGGLFVPIFNLLLQFDAKTSAALCNFMIFGGMFANISLNSLQHHPSHSERSMIDLDAALLIQPNMLLGICLGVFCNVMFPGWLIILLLTIILIVVTSRSCGYGVRLWKKESCIAFHERTMLARVTGCMAHEEGNKCGTNHDMIAESVCGTETLPISLENGDIAAVVRSNESNVTAKEAETQSKLPQNSLQEPLLPLGSPEGSNYSYMKLLMLVIVWFAFFALQILRGGKTSEKEGDLLPAAYTMLPVMALLAGILGGMLGIGGGMIINPILLEIGMLPQVTAATSALLVFFSSSLSVVQFWLMGRIPIEHAIIFAILCFVFSGLGLLTLQRVITRYGRASLIVFCLSFVMGLSAILMGFFGSLDVWGQYSRGEYMGFHTPC
ncbi:hypothetical protein O6H91_11G053900 [Diphasiastrum complanatum]|uniref:Uncharacterized protein n=1 Tax=Diphasiastrum complanatum TaxID=34168 RepID=A0ACC2C968_DIPCM|nr:hypothetical protein O6H91_11G053900 [Diphasiastrum complanatum]